MKEILVERSRDYLRIAIKDNGGLTDIFVEEDKGEALPGQIYKGVVKNIIPSLKSAFIDIGTEKNAFLFLDGKYEKKGIKNGDDIIVEVIKEAAGDKGAKVTSAFTLPGKCCVLSNGDHKLSFSNKISDKSFIETIQKSIIKPKHIGLKMRTNSTMFSIDDINEEIEKLYDIYLSIIKQASYKIKPGLLYSDGGTLARVLRDNCDFSNSKIVVDNEKDFTIISQLGITPQLYEGKLNLFYKYGVEKEVLKLQKRKVELPCGGNIVLEKTEAMHVIDVNTAGNIKGNSLNQAAFQTNLEAAKAIGNQVRLRNLSGIILVDFIDMKKDSEKRAVINQLENAFDGDKNNTFIYPFTELNLVQIVRRRRGKSTLEYFQNKCICCNGEGLLLSNTYMAQIIRNEIIRICEKKERKNIHIILNANYEKQISKDLEMLTDKINLENINLYLSFSEDVDLFKISIVAFDEDLQKLYEFKIN